MGSNKQDNGQHTQSNSFNQKEIVEHVTHNGNGWDCDVASRLKKNKLHHAVYREKCANAQKSEQQIQRLLTKTC